MELPEKRNYNWRKYSLPTVSVSTLAKQLRIRRTSADDRYTVVGICAMAKKTNAAPMQSILTRLEQQEYIRVVIFSDNTILREPIEEWPLCSCLVAFYSEGFPLKKALDYVKLRGPMLINDLKMQYVLMDRRQVYETLTKNGVEVPKYVVLNRPEIGTAGSDLLLETDDTIEVGGKIFHKPFVEKPVSAEDHSVYIYFPSDYGGGCQQLFRKVKNRSSTYSQESSVRKTGSYIYEEFMPTDGTDVKVYTVGPDYAHAEARKSPALDGKVERDDQGKEKRYPVFLTATEKLIARQVCIAFKQTVCGFDLLRANGRSYVCDVNGFSFVKNSEKYYEDCAQILLTNTGEGLVNSSRGVMFLDIVWIGWMWNIPGKLLIKEMITTKLAPDHIPHIPPSVEYMAEEVPVPIITAGNTLELRCVIGVIRHGDRTPKQKMKMIVKHKKFFDLFEELGGHKTGQLKIKKPKQLQKVLDIARYLLANIDKYSESHEVEEKVHKLQQLKSVLEMYGYFSGINRKVQLKQVKNRNKRGETVLLLILKWGGELTPAGQKQAEELGRAFRCMYPGGEGEYASLPGSGFLRLHSTYRHDLKVYASDEGRVQMTAAAFTKGLLDLEGNLASILVHLVKRDQNATNMLDTSTSAQEAMLNVKEKLHDLLRSPEDFTEESFQEITPTGAESLVSAMKNIRNPWVACEQLYLKIRAVLAEIESLPRNVMLYHNETLQMMKSRWRKLDKDFKKSDGQFDISKIPDIYDCIKYDLHHNSHLNLKNGDDLFRCAMNLADIVIPQEYGITESEKLDIATKICSPLLRKIHSDFQHTIVNGETDIIYRLNPRLSRGVITPNRHVRTRLYFTSESHVHSMVNILRYGKMVENPDIQTWRDTMEQMNKFPELNYMTQIVLMLFEDVSQPEDSEQRYRVDVHFSPGVKGRLELLQKGSKESKELPLGASGTTPPGTKSSPEEVSQSSMWVKRLPINLEMLVDDPIRQGNAPSLGSKSTPNMSLKTPEPGRSLKSASEGQLQKLRSSKLAPKGDHLASHSQSLDHKEDDGENLASRSEHLKSHSETMLERIFFTQEDNGEKLAPKSEPLESHSETISILQEVDEEDLTSTSEYVDFHPETTLDHTSEEEFTSESEHLKSHSPTQCHISILQEDRERGGGKVAGKGSKTRLQVGSQLSEVSTSPSDRHLNLVASGRGTYSDGSHHSLKEIDLLPGLELAAELASTVEPLIPVWSAPLSKMNAFLTKLTGVSLDYTKADPVALDSLSTGIPTPTPSTPTPTPTPTPVHSRSTTPRASLEPLNILSSGSIEN